ncbi:Smr domain-containing protein like [Verticillium longisporum]|nr:Smr domain-containing protein like [Verticillium longisporum]
MRGRKKDDDADDLSELGEPRLDGTDAHVFSSSIGAGGYIPHHKEPPRYIKVRAHHKKTREFNRMFLAQELSTAPQPDDETELPSSAASTASGKKRPHKTGAVWALEFSKDGHPDLEDILFIAEKLDLPYDEASHAFHLQGCSRERTIIDYLDSYIQQGARATSEASRARVRELSNLYRSIPEKYIPPLIGIAGDVDQWVDELASLLNTYFAHLGPQRLAVDYKLTPLVGAEIEAFTPATASKAHNRGASSAMPPPPPPMAQSSQPQTYQDALHAASAHAAARSHSYTAAAASFKKGGSNPLYRQAAAYYAERGRAQAQTYAQARSVAADMLVTDNSSRKAIDLHGVEVVDGVRIARERAWAWWQGLGEYRDLEARDGFTVITGLGRHSAGGVSRMRQSVAAALIEDGWKVSVETGRFRITGRRRAV